VEVDKYKILFLGKSGEYFEQLFYCDGSKPALVSSLTCSLPMVTLREEPFSLVYLDSVYVKVIAHNARGWSDDYPLNDEIFAPKI